MPQGRDIGETGPKSVTFVTVDDGIVTIEERSTSIVEFNRLVCSLDGISDWREAVQYITGMLKVTAGSSSDHNVLRLILEGVTPLAWRIRRDHDLLAEQISEAARAIGTIWIEKIENRLTPPVAEVNATDARSELLSIMFSLTADENFSNRAMRSVEELITDLPPEIRNEFGDTEGERAEIVMELLREGVDDISARMMGDQTVGHE
jgi:hypothetical protein